MGYLEGLVIMKILYGNTSSWSYGGNPAVYFCFRFVNTTVTDAVVTALASTFHAPPHLPICSLQMSPVPPATLSWTVSPPSSTDRASYIVRPATLQDTASITDAIVHVVAHDGFHDQFFPHQDKYPKDFYAWWYRYFRDMILKPRSVVLIAVDSSSDVVGMGAWSYSLMAKQAPPPIGLHIDKNSWFEGIVIFASSLPFH
jgi:hypothetical protein